jgi:hypothetical protein
VLIHGEFVDHRDLGGWATKGTCSDPTPYDEICFSSHGFLVWSRF